MKTQKEKPDDLDVLIGQISLDDVLAGIDDGTNGKPVDEFGVQS